MTRIDAKFEDLRARGKKAFVSYVMAGDPDFDRSLEIVRGLPAGWAARARDGAERASIAVLVSASVFLLVTGLLNSTQWYPWDFSFRRSHYALAWVATGALVLHLAVKLPTIREALGRDVDDTGLDRPEAVVRGGLSRRGLLRSTWAAAGLAVLATAGSTVPWLRRVSVLGVRSGDGPGGVPINRTAAAAGVEESASSPTYRLVVAHAGTTVSLTREDLLAMPQRSEELPIACVEGWSASAVWTGVRLRDLLDLVDAPRGAEVEVTSLQERGTMFVEPTTEVYEGMIVGENSRADDMDVNITKEKQQTNIRSATSDNFEKLIPPRKLSLEQCLEFCREDECVEVTPDSVRIRKVILDQNERAKIASRARNGAPAPRCGGSHMRRSMYRTGC